MGKLMNVRGGLFAYMSQCKLCTVDTQIQGTTAPIGTTDEKQLWEIIRKGLKSAKIYHFLNSNRFK
jgi:hypothetical protein